MEQKQLVSSYHQSIHNLKTRSQKQSLSHSSGLSTAQSQKTYSSYSSYSHLNNFRPSIIYPPTLSQKQSFALLPFSLPLSLKENNRFLDSRNHENRLQKLNSCQVYTKQCEQQNKKHQKESMKSTQNIQNSYEFRNNDLTVIKKFMSKPVIQNQKYVKTSQDRVNAKIVTEFYCDQEDISPDNILQILKENNLNQRNPSRNACNRRQIVALNLKLKDILLTKYHLHHIPNPLSCNDKKRNLPKQRQKIDKKNRKGMKELTIQKLHKILRRKDQNKNLLPEQRHKKAMKLITDIEQNNGKQGLQFRKSFLQLLRQINDSFYIKDPYLQNYSNQSGQKSCMYEQDISSKGDYELEKHELMNI